MPFENLKPKVIAILANENQTRDQKLKRFASYCMTTLIIITGLGFILPIMKPKHFI
jgi:hypothetical protein